MLHTCRYTRRTAGHIWPICSAWFLTYRKVESHIISRLRLPNTLPFSGLLRTSGSAIPPRETNWLTVPTGGGAVTTTQNGIELTETSRMIALSRNVGHVGPYTERYCSGTCFFFRLRQNCRYQMFFFHLRDVTSPFLLLCSAPPPSLSPTSQQFHRSSSHSARCVLETLLLLVASFLETHFFLSQTLAATWWWSRYHGYVLPFPALKQH